MKDTLEVHPMQEVFYVILLNQKSRPLGRVAITSSTVNSALLQRGAERLGLIGSDIDERDFEPRGDWYAGKDEILDLSQRTEFLAELIVAS